MLLLLEEMWKAERKYALRITGYGKDGGDGGPALARARFSDNEYISDRLMKLREKRRLVVSII